MVMVRTFELLTGIRIDHYVGVDLAGFKQISDAIGGVQVCLLPSNYVGTTTEAGISHTSTISMTAAGSSAASSASKPSSAIKRWRSSANATDSLTATSDASNASSSS